MAKVGRLVKDLIIQEVGSALKQQPSFFVTSVGPLQAADADALRKKLRGSHARMLMVKRTLGIRSVGTVGATDGITAFFEGQIALVIPGEDIIPAAKLLCDFAKVNEGKIVIRGGWVDGQLLSKQRLEEFANLPSRPQLIAEVIGALEAPLVDLIFTVERVLGNVAWVLEEASKAQPQAAKSTPQAEGSQAQQQEGTSNAS